MPDLPDFEIHSCIWLGNGLFAGKVYGLLVYYYREAIISFEPSNMEGLPFRVEKIPKAQLALPGIVDFEIYERVFQVNGQQYNFFRRSEHVGSICYDVFVVTGLTAIRLMNDLYTNKAGLFLRAILICWTCWKSGNSTGRLYWKFYPDLF